jgi:hypothetical protein
MCIIFGIFSITMKSIIVTVGKSLRLWNISNSYETSGMGHFGEMRELQEYYYLGNSLLHYHPQAI